MSGPPRARRCRAVAAAGMLVELDTGGLRKPVGEPFPGPALLAEARTLASRSSSVSDATRPGRRRAAARPPADRLALAGRLP